MHRLTISLFLLTLCGTCIARDDMTADEMKTFYRSIQDSQTNDKRIRPNQGGEPVQVAVTLYVISMHEHSAADIKFSFYFRQTWTDPRLTHNSPGDMMGGSDLLKLIWTPDTFFANSREGKVFETTVPNTYVRIKSNGEVTTSVRLTEQFICRSRQDPYSMDEIHCNLEIESYGYSAKDIKYTWKGNNSVALDAELNTDHLVVLGHKQKTSTISLSTGVYTRLIATFHLTPRYNAYHLYRKSFLPLVVVTALTFATFCIRASALRTAITLSSCLSSCLLVVLLNRSLPATPCFTVFDYVSVICIIFSILSLVNEVRYHQTKSLGDKGETTEKNGNVETAGKETITQRLKDQLIAKAVPIAFVVVLLCIQIIMTAKYGIL